MVYTGPWRTVNSLQKLRTQCNTAWPNRSKASDGTIADDSHSTTSDHYPHLVSTLGSTPVVTAFDLTQDPAHGCDCASVTEAIRLSRDGRVKYVIWDHRMYSSYSSSGYAAWTWRPYTGSNDPHTNHMHISVLDALSADDSRPWSIGVDTMGLTPEEYAEIVKGNLTPNNVMHFRLRGLCDGKDPSLQVYYDKGWTEIVGNKQIAESLTTVADDVTAIREALEANSAPVSGFTEQEIRTFVREEIESVFVRARYRVDPQI